MQNKDVKAILEKIDSGHYTPEEEAIAKYWLHQLNQQGDAGLTDEDLSEGRKEMWLAIQAAKQPRATRIRLWTRIASAASVLLFLSIGGYFLLHKQTTPQITRYVIHDVAPGGNKAMLTLANGKTIVLTDAKNGMLAEQGSIAINKTTDGEVVYRAGQGSSAKESAKLSVTYNTLSTPRGGQYNLTLSDGTKVWLNAASSITFPTAFAGNERKVEITGEAYFEVMHNAAKPFRVTTLGQTVEVLGTHFNINGYSDEGMIRTTLLEGSVRIRTRSQNAMLKPGQQAQTIMGGSNTPIAVINDADTDEAVAWHLGLFKFHSANIQTVMRQLCRWYNVEVKYEGKIPDREFSGEITRNVNASQVFEILSYFKVHFRIEQGATEKTIIVTP
jgi:transmembrane sensor